jgi:ADP-dependent phosphofructokinase/glucokinase
VREGDVIMNAEVWESLYQSMRKPPMDPVLTGFNANLDRVIPVTTDLIRMLERRVPGREILRDRLLSSMRYSTADEWFVTDSNMYHDIAKFFSAAGTLAIGGQAGIAAVHLRRLGIPSVVCAVPGAGPHTCDMLQDAGVIPLTFESGAGDRFDTTHLIFEYPPNLVQVAEQVVPRSNRFIVSPVHDPSTVFIPDNAMDNFLDRIKSCRRAFLSGYQYLRKEHEFITAARQIQMIRSANPLMRTHVECVSVADRSVLAMMLRHIIPNTDSIGLNEYELALFMHALRGTDPGSAASLPLSPVACVREAIALADATAVRRIHLHTFGYYILILEPGTAQPEKSQHALLIAARETADAAGGDRQILSPDGLLAYDAVREAIGPDQTTGIFAAGDRVVILVPTYISQNINKTTGLGDMLSSTAFVADQF